MQVSKLFELSTFRLININLTFKTQSPSMVLGVYSYNLYTLSFMYARDKSISVYNSGCELLSN